MYGYTLYSVHFMQYSMCRAGHRTRYLKYLAKKGAAAYRYSNKQVAPLPLFACKTAGCRYFKKMNSTKNDGIQIRYLMVKFQLYLRKLIIQAF